VRVVGNPGELAELFEADREAHVYGLADLEEPFWSHSTWYRRGDAAVGVVSVGDRWVTGYAMSRVAPQETLTLLTDINETIPAGTWVTGSLGLYEAMSGVRSARDIGAHWRMILDGPTDSDGSSGAVQLRPGDLDALDDLHASDEGRAFFLPAMLAGNPFVGIWEGDQLVASAGTHVASKRYGVAAIGAVITRPSHRGRGLASEALAALCSRLVDEYETIGLNVETANTAALRLYDRLGFRRVFQYEEIELL
jgi:ribosomal protein S18 acetylase RimI-like enzyme